MLSTRTQLLLDASTTNDGLVKHPWLLALEGGHFFAGMSRAELRLRLLGASCATAPLVADIDHAVLGVPAAKLGLSTPIHPEIRSRGATWVVTNLAADVNHAGLSVPAAELRLPVAVILAVAGSGVAALVAASVGSDVDHPLLCVPRAVLCLAPLDAVHRLCPAARVLASRAVHVDHAVLGVTRAELGFLAAVDAVAGSRRALRVGARPAEEIHHPVLGVTGAEPWVSAGWHTVARSRFAAGLAARVVGAWPLGTDVHHAVLGVCAAELRLRGTARRPEECLRVAEWMLAPSPAANQVYHPILGVPTAKLRPFALLPKQRDLCAGRVAARLLAVEVHHPIARVPSAKLCRFPALGVVTVAGIGGAGRMAALPLHHTTAAVLSRDVVMVTAVVVTGNPR